ncbi:MAG: methyltransferase domain-containing protein, partial [Bryobacteraceae bacterium]
LDSPAQEAWLDDARSVPAIDRILAKRGQIGAVQTAEEVASEYNRLATLGKSTALHKLDNWALFSKRDWNKLCTRTAEWIGIRDGDSVFESGCGAGAFLQILHQSYRVKVAGADLAEKLVDIARLRLPGQFWVGDMQDLSFVPDQSYDCVVSHGVFLYLPSIAAAERSASEMVRIAKKGGRIYVGVLNDPDRLPSARATDGHKPSGNFLLFRDFWRDFAARADLEIQVVDQEQIYSRRKGYDAHAPFRYSVLLRKPP